MDDKTYTERTDSVEQVARKDSLEALISDMLKERYMLMYLVDDGTQRANVAKMHQDEFVKRAKALGVTV